MLWVADDMENYNLTCWSLMITFFVAKKQSISWSGLVHGFQIVSVTTGGAIIGGVVSGDRANGAIASWIQSTTCDIKCLWKAKFRNLFSYFDLAVHKLQWQKLKRIIVTILTRNPIDVSTSQMRAKLVRQWPNFVANFQIWNAYFQPNCLDCDQCQVDCQRHHCHEHWRSLLLWHRC